MFWSTGVSQEYDDIMTLHVGSQSMTRREHDRCVKLEDYLFDAQTVAMEIHLDMIKRKDDTKVIQHIQDTLGELLQIATQLQERANVLG